GRRRSRVARRRCAPASAATDPASPSSDLAALELDERPEALASVLGQADDEAVLGRVHHHVAGGGLAGLGDLAPAVLLSVVLDQRVNPPVVAARARLVADREGGLRDLVGAGDQ